MDAMACSATECTAAPRLLVADDHQLVAQGLERLLRESFREVSLVRSGEALVEAVRAGNADLVIADISMDGISGIEAMRLLRAEGHAVPFVFLTMHTDPGLAAEAIRSGGSAYVLKSSAGEELVQAVHEVLAGRTYITPTLAAPAISRMAAPRRALTEKQRNILVRVAQGLRSKQIAYELGVSVRTVESHKYAIMRELDVHGTVELVRRAEELGLIPGLAGLRK